MCTHANTHLRHRNILTCESTCTCECALALNDLSFPPYPVIVLTFPFLFLYNIHWQKRETKQQQKAYKCYRNPFYLLLIIRLFIFPHISRHHLTYEFSVSIHTHTHTYTQIHTHTHTYTQINTHTHTYIYISAKVAPCVIFSLVGEG